MRTYGARKVIRFLKPALERERAIFIRTLRVKYARRGWIRDLISPSPEPVIAGYEIDSFIDPVVLQRNLTPKIRNTKLPQRREGAKKIVILRVFEPSWL